MLELFAKNYPIIPNNRYLVFGDQPAKTMDSSKFGFAKTKNIIGKLIEK